MDVRLRRCCPLPASVDCQRRHGRSRIHRRHLLHLAAAGCVLNLYREAAALGIELAGVRVTAAGGFDTATWQSTGIGYRVEVSSDAPAGQLAHLLEVVDQVAEIPVPFEPDPSSGGSAEPDPGKRQRRSAFAARTLTERPQLRMRMSGT
jgi:hypothetical protein